jgi:hypothetical protein
VKYGKLGLPAAGDTNWVLIEGAISHFCFADGGENVAQMLERVRAEGIASTSKFAAAIKRFEGHDIVVRAAEGEEAFACVVGTHIVVGAFCGAYMLDDRDKVRIVARRMADGRFHAIAVERARDGLLWMPQYTWSGAHAQVTQASKIDGQLSFWAAMVVLTLGLILFGFLVDSPWPHRAVWVMGWIILMKMGTSVFDVAVEHPAPEHHEGSRIFRMLSYPDPDNLDMDIVRLDRIDDESSWRPVYRYKDALKIHAGPVKHSDGKLN